MEASERPVEHAVRTASGLEKSCHVTTCDRAIALHVTVVKHRQPPFFLQFRHDFRCPDGTVVVPDIRIRPRHIVEIGVARPILFRTQTGHLFQRFQQTDIFIHHRFTAPCRLIDRLHDQFRPAAIFHFLQHGLPERLMNCKELIISHFQPLLPGECHARIRQKDDRTRITMPFVRLHRRHKRVVFFPCQNGFSVFITAVIDVWRNAQSKRRHAKAPHIGQVTVNQCDIARMRIVFTEKLRFLIRQGKSTDANFHGNRCLHAVQIQHRHTFI